MHSSFDLPPAPLEIKWRYEVTGAPVRLIGDLDPFIFQPHPVAVNQSFPTVYESGFAIPLHSDIVVP